MKAQRQYKITEEQYQEIAAAAAAEQMVTRLMDLAKEVAGPIVQRERANTWSRLQALAGSRNNASASEGGAAAPGAAERDPMPVKRRGKRYAEAAQPEAPAPVVNGPVQAELRDNAN